MTALIVAQLVVFLVLTAATEAAFDMDDHVSAMVAALLMMLAGGLIAIAIEGPVVAVTAIVGAMVLMLARMIDEVLL